MIGSGTNCAGQCLSVCAPSRAIYDRSERSPHHRSVRHVNSPRRSRRGFSSVPARAPLPHHAADVGRDDGEVAVAELAAAPQLGQSAFFLSFAGTEKWFRSCT